MPRCAASVRVPLKLWRALKPTLYTTPAKALTIADSQRLNPHRHTKLTTLHPSRWTPRTVIDLLAAASSPVLVIAFVWSCTGFCVNKESDEKRMSVFEACRLEKARPPILPWGDRTGPERRCVSVCVWCEDPVLVSEVGGKKVSQSASGRWGWCTVQTTLWMMHSFLSSFNSSGQFDYAGKHTGLYKWGTESDRGRERQSG